MKVPLHYYCDFDNEKLSSDDVELDVVGRLVEVKIGPTSHYGELPPPRVGSNTIDMTISRLKSLYDIEPSIDTTVDVVVEVLESIKKGLEGETS